MVLGQKVENDLGHVFRGEFPRVFVGRLPSRELSGHTSRHNVTDLDILVAKIEHEGFTQTLETELGGVVKGATHESVFARQTADIDDGAAAPVPEVRKGCVAAIKDPRQVRIDDLIPLLGRGLTDGTEDPQTGVVDQNVDPTGFFGGEPHESFYVLVLSDVARDSSGLELRAGQFLDRAPHIRLPARRHDNLRSLSSQGLGDGFADAFRRPGDDGDFILEIHDVLLRTTV